MRSAQCILVPLCLALLCFGAAGISPAAELQTRKNGIDMEFVLIPAGSFMMGTDLNFEEGAGDETPRHNVAISKPFFLGKYEVTQTQWVAVMGSNPSKFKGRSNPVEQVSWDDVQAFILKLNQKEGHARYRLPTEAEWEYAARAGTNGAYSFGDDKNKLSGYAWYGENYAEGSTHPVGGKRPNPWGLHDVHGNVWEWVQDWYDERYYAESPLTDPGGPVSGSSRVKRGGSWGNSAGLCRSGDRDDDSPDYRYDYLGFRLALSPE